LTRERDERIIVAPMTHVFAAERNSQGLALRFVALACLSGECLEQETMPERRDHADTGRPIARW
jgi:hypothetical protein